MLAYFAPSDSSYMGLNRSQVEGKCRLHHIPAISTLCVNSYASLNYLCRITYSTYYDLWVVMNTPLAYVNIRVLLPAASIEKHIHLCRGCDCFLGEWREKVWMIAWMVWFEVLLWGAYSVKILLIACVEIVIIIYTSSCTCFAYTTT